MGSVAQRVIRRGTGVSRWFTTVSSAILVLVRGFSIFLYSAHNFLPTAVELVLQKAHGVEKAVYNNMGGVTNEYKAKIRSLFVNLKDNSNPGLRVSIVEGIVSPEKFAKMSSQVSSLSNKMLGLTDILNRKWRQRRERQLIRRLKKKTSSNRYLRRRSRQRPMHSSARGANR